MEFSFLLTILFSEGFEFLQLPIPGLSLPNGESATFWELLLAFALASLGISLLRYVLDVGNGGDTPRTGSTKNPKISKERRHDEK